jgi:hypothetical protein
VCHAKSCDISCPGLQSCKELSCAGSAKTCNIECGGVQSCGTSVQSTAVQTTIACTGQDTCAGAINECCTGGAVCSGQYKPACF